MTRPSLTRLLAAFCLVAPPLAAPAALAQGSIKPLRLGVPFPAGGATE